VSPVIVFALLGCATKSPAPAPVAPEPLAYPQARRGDIVDTFHGVQVADPYRWLETPDSDETRAWIDAENALTQDWLGAIDARPGLRQRLEELWNYEKFGMPRTEGGRTFYTRNDGLQSHSVLYWAQGPQAEPQVLLDPNTLSEDGTVSLGGWSVSEDGRYLAYALSDGGSDWRTVHVRDVETGQDLDDALSWVKFSGLSWAADSSGFYYSRYPAPEDPLEQVNLHQQLWFHPVGASQDQDRLVYERADQPTWGFGGLVTDDGERLIVHVSEGTEELNRIYTQDLTVADAPVVPLLDERDAGYRFVGRIDGELWFLTNLEAPRYRLIRVDPSAPSDARITEVVPQGDDVLEDVDLVGGRLVLTWISDAHSRVELRDLDGGPGAELALPGIGSAWGFDGDADAGTVFYGFTGFTDPRSVYSLELATGTSTLWKRPQVDFDPGAYETVQVFYESADGTRVPMFLTHKKGLVLDGENPTLLYGYGGFNISLTPWFSIANLVWMELGGVYAMPNLRGGGEYGADWHEAGTLQQKQNVFDDFIGAAQWLVAQRYTRPERLAIRGGSNGGLLVGACLLQRPDLFGAALPEVGVLDMLRYHLFTIGWAWASDYGTVDDSPEMFQALLDYSPVHNTVPGTAYPSTMIVTADHDDRVVPAHSFKFAAALQHAQAGPEPTLIRIETRAGHGAGKSTEMRLDEAADKWAFLVEALGVDSPYSVPASDNP